MILMHNAIHQTIYQQAEHRWRKIWVIVIALIFAIQAGVAGFALYHYHHVSIQLEPLQANVQQNQAKIVLLKQWKAAIKTYDASHEQRKANKQRVEDMYARLADYHAVNLRLLRIKPNYIYCGIEGISESAVQQYQSYLKKMHYKPVSQQLIEKIWFLEFVRHDSA